MCKQIIKNVTVRADEHWNHFKTPEHGGTGTSKLQNRRPSEHMRKTLTITRSAMN